MPALFPGSVRIYSSKTDLVDTVLADHVNLLQDEVTAVESTLGTGLLTSTWSGTFTTLNLVHDTLSLRLLNIESGILSRAPLASPTLTGTPLAPTASADTNTTQIATTAFVVGQASSSTPTMDGSATIGTSLKFARADHVHPTDTSRAPLASPALTGTPTAPTASADTSTTQLATTAFVVGQGYLKSTTASSTYAPLDSPALVGIPTAPTASSGTSSTQLATTAFVANSLASAASSAEIPLSPFLLAGM